MAWWWFFEVEVEYDVIDLTAKSSAQRTGPSRQ
jgi:hypothetical protein